MKKIFTLLVAAVMLAAGVNAAFEKVNTYNGNFSDVADTAWYAQNVKTAYELGFMNGKSDGKFDPNGNVTVAEGIVMASRLNAIYNGKEIDTSAKSVEYRIDFDDPSFFVDLTARNSRNDSGVSVKRATGKIENGMLIVQSDGVNQYGSYDPQIKFEGLDLDTKLYNKITFRMKRDALPNPNNNARTESVELFFETSSEGSITADKCVIADLKDVENLRDWFEIEICLDQHEKYKDYLRGFRFDPTNNNGIYYIDYVKFSTAETAESAPKWYDPYVRYAVDNGIVQKDKFKVADYNKNISRFDLCDMFIAALPLEHFTPINDIKGIPDIKFNDPQADAYLMLYRAGVLLGTDDKGTFNGKSDIKRSEVAAIINRMALPENRVEGTIEADWSDNFSEYDVDFDDESELSGITFEWADTEVKDGYAILKTRDKGEGKTARFDPRFVVKGINLDSSQYEKVRVRMKADFAGEVAEPSYDFYFMTDSDSGFSEPKSFHNIIHSHYLDHTGWYVFDIDLRLCPTWKGNVTGFRFDPANSEGTYTIDYVRFIKGDYFELTTVEELRAAGYTETRIYQDEGFERGFYVQRISNTATSSKEGLFQDYCETDEKPLWRISPYWAQFDLVDDRDLTTDKYTIKDKHDANTIIYNPEEKSLTMRVNSYPMYDGKPHYQDDKSTPDVDEGNYMWWPHLLVSQDTDICPIDKERNSANADRMFIECDIRLLDFEDSKITEGMRSANFMAYLYLRTDKAPGDLIWFGINFFNGTRVDDTTKCSWAPDSAAHQYMYKMSQGMLYNGVENSFVPEKGVVKTGEEWKHISFDVTPHIQQAVDWANRDNAFGTPVTVEDMYFEGLNIGYETWGSFDYTIEFKNFNLVAYNKD